MISRISPDALQKIITGNMREPGACVIKFYSNQCHYCISLKDGFHKVAAKHPDINFFAFNVQDYPKIDSLIKLNGVPSVIFVKNDFSGKVSILEDPENPHHETWYYLEDINNFIEINK